MSEITNTEEQKLDPNIIEFEYFSEEEFDELTSELEKYHNIFSMIWKFGMPVYTRAIPTAAVMFNKFGSDIAWAINPDYWNTLTLEQKKFIICHECLHVLYNHGYRIFKDLIQHKASKKELMFANWMTDIVNNETLVDSYGFDRKEIDPENKYCWFDTIFGDSNSVQEINNKLKNSGNRYLPQKITQADCFEIYYAVGKWLQEQGGKTNGKIDNGGFANNSSQTVDDHSGFTDQEFEDLLNNIEAREKLIDYLNENLTQEELDKLNQDSQQIGDEKGDSNLDKKIQSKLPGVNPGNSMIRLKAKIVKKKKWETIIKNWAMKFISTTDQEQWARENRRFQFLNQDLFIPSEFEIEHTEKDKIEVYFYIDTSGSCIGYTQRFIDAANSLPKEKFSVRCFCFDTRVYPVDLKKGELYGFGGTAFNILETNILNIMAKEKVPYPKAVFVITDGYGTTIENKEPKNWFWFLTEDGDYALDYLKRLVSKDCNIYQLKDFE